MTPLATCECFIWWHAWDSNVQIQHKTKNFSDDDSNKFYNPRRDVVVAPEWRTPRRVVCERNIIGVKHNKMILIMLLHIMNSKMLMKKIVCRYCLECLVHFMAYSDFFHHRHCTYDRFLLNPDCNLRLALHSQLFVVSWGKPQNWSEVEEDELHAHTFLQLIKSNNQLHPSRGLLQGFRDINSD